MSDYCWKTGIVKGVNANDAALELKRIESIHGTLTPEAIEKESKSSKSLFHNYFIWDNVRAGHKYRLYQAQRLINNIQIKIITDNETRKIDVYEVIIHGSGWKNIDTFDKEDIKIIRDRTLKEIGFLKKKLITYSEFDKVIPYLDRAVEELNDMDS